MTGRIVSINVSASGVPKLPVDAAEVRAEGHPIAPGTAGENLTLAGVEWTRVVPGTRLVFASGVELEATGYCTPCAKITGSFQDGDGNRLLQDRHPGESRVHTRVLRPGRLAAGETFRLA